MHKIYLQNHFYGENTSENIIKIVENLVSSGILTNWILCCQGYTAGTYDDHNEEIKVPKVYHKVTQATDTEKKETKTKQENR